MKAYRYWFVKFYFDIEVCGEKDKIKYLIIFWKEDKARQFYDFIKTKKAKYVRCNQHENPSDYEIGVTGRFYDDWTDYWGDDFELFFKEEIVPISPCVKIL